MNIIIKLSTLRSSRTWKKIVKYSLFVLKLTIVIALYVWFWLNENHFQWNYVNSNANGTILHVADMLAIAACFLHQIIKSISNVLYRASDTKNLVNSIREINLLLNNDNKNSKSLSSLIIISNGICILYDLSYKTNRYGWFGFFYGSSYLIFIIFIQVEVILMVNILNKLKQNLLLMNRQHIRTKKIGTVIAMSTKIYETVRLAHRVFEIPIVTIVMICVSYLGCQIYFFLQALIDAEENFDIHMWLQSIGWILIFSINVVSIIMPWMCITVEAKRIATHVHDIWNNRTAKNLINSNLNHLRFISLQLLNRDLNFTAYGFFPLDWTLLHAIIGAITSYVVILVQFEVASHNI